MSLDNLGQKHLRYNFFYVLRLSRNKNIFGRKKDFYVLGQSIGIKTSSVEGKIFISWDSLGIKTSSVERKIFKFLLKNICDKKI
jgi:hypothetical protein